MNIFYRISNQKRIVQIDLPHFTISVDLKSALLSRNFILEELVNNIAQQASFFKGDSFMLFNGFVRNKQMISNWPKQIDCIQNKITA